MAGDGWLRLAQRPGARSATLTLLLAGLIALAVAVRADEPVVTTLADYEDDSVAALVTDVENVLASDCAVSMTAIPARGQRSLMVEIGATEQNASAACDLRFRLETPFQQANRVATHAWIKRSSVDIRFRVRDAAGVLFETEALPLDSHNRWVRLAAELSPRGLTAVGGSAPPGELKERRVTWPIEIQGYRIGTHGIGRQTVYLDDLEVEHRTSGAGMVRGEFRLGEPTHIYGPGALIRAQVVLENLSRARALPLTVQLAWLRADGSELATHRVSLNLPAGGADYRSRQPVDFSQRIYAPGLYRLVARVRGPGWISPALETTIAVTNTNRALPRGRATFFGVCTNLLREPLADQLLEIDIADEIGVQLLAIETPWRTIELNPGSYDFEPLDRLIDRITQRDIAAMIVLTEPPDWLAARDGNVWSRQATLFEVLARRYGKRISAYQPLAPDPSGSRPLDAADLTALRQIRAAVAEIYSEGDLVSPPLRVREGGVAGFSTSDWPQDANLQLAFETTGDSASALESLERFAAKNDLSWSRAHRWFHRSAPLIGSGTLYDAVAVLRHYVRAARDGVAGVVWFDLRDDTNDRRQPQLMNGLVQRDFSPKTPLLGFANAVGMLHGLRYAGELIGTPAEFESALFIGGNQQVAVLFPKPNRVLPALLAPYHVVDGALRVFDFDRREQALLSYGHAVLAPAPVHPCFVILDALRAQTDPKVGLARPWLRAPHTVYCGKQTTFRIEIDAPTELRRSYLQVLLPEDSRIESSLSSRSLRAQAGESLAFDVTLTRTGEGPIEPGTLTLRLRIEGENLTVPIVLRPLAEVRPLPTGARLVNSEFAIGRLMAPPQQESVDEDRAVGALHAAYDSRALHIAVELPSRAAPDATLQVGIAAEDADAHTEAQVDNLASRPRLRPSFGASYVDIRGWQCSPLGEADARERFYEITIPAASLDLAGFEPDTRLLLAVRYLEPPADRWTLPRELEWGSGLDGARSTEGFKWVRLAPGAVRD